MSDFVLSLIPTDSAYVPPPEAQEQAVALLEEFFPEGHDCRAENHGALILVHPHENVLAILCPSCGKRSKIDHFSEDNGISGWWLQVQEAAMVNADITVVMPCCGQPIPLPSLGTDSPSGFAHFELSIWNIESEDGLEPTALSKLEEILGCKLLQIRAHL